MTLDDAGFLVALFGGVLFGCLFLSAFYNFQDRREQRRADEEMRRHVGGSR